MKQFEHIYNWVFVVVALIVSFGSLTGAAYARDGDDARPFSRLVIFGDSLSDPGNVFVVTGEFEVRPFDLIPDRPYAIGRLHFSNGRTWVERLAATLRLRRSARPALLVPGLFSNYAFGAARARPESGQPFDLSAQINLFLSDFGGGAPSDALYIVFVGGNDIRDAIEALASDPTGTTSTSIIRAAVQAVADNVVSLAIAGARTFLIANAPDLSLAPAVSMDPNPLVPVLAQSFSVEFNDALTEALMNAETMLPIEIEIIPFDVFGVITEVVDSPSAFGLSNVTESCITPEVIRRAICRKPDEYLFWDGIHPTRAAHAILARRAEETLAVAAVAHEAENGERLEAVSYSTR